jgi:hypothetical protein
MTKIALVVAVITAGCTHWETVERPRPPQEVGRTMVGSPQIEEVTASNASAGFAMTGESYRSRRYSSGYTIGGLSGSSGSSRRTHCVQQAQIDLVQTVDFETRMTGRSLDIAGGLILGGIGLITIAAANSAYNRDLEWHNMDDFFAKPETPTGAYAVGGIMGVGGLAWIVYSLGSLPKGPKPERASAERRWTETAFVEATGCGLVPGDRAQAVSTPMPAP